MRWLVILLPLLLMCAEVQGEPRVILGGSLEETDFGELADFSEDKYNINFKELVKSTATGSFFSAEKITDTFFDLVFGEIRNNGDIIKKILLICILCGIITALTKGMGSGETETAASFAAFTAIGSMLCAGFKLCSDVLIEGAENITELIRAAMPVIIALTAAGGGESTGFAAVLSLSADILNIFIKNVVLPQIVFSVMLGMLNCLCDRPMAGKLSELFSLTASWLLKISAFAFAGCLTLCRMGMGLTSLGGKGIKLAAGSVPVVGNLFEGSLETVAALINALKGSTGAAIIILLVIMSSAHLVKMTAVMLMYKLTAGLSEPMGNSRITEMIDIVSEGIRLIIGAYFTVLVMFVTAVAVTLGTL